MNILSSFARRANSVRQWIGVIGSVLAIIGLVTFSEFMMEESLQTVMFGTWPAKDSGDWKQVAKGADIMENIATKLRWVNNLFGWIQPLSWVAYDSYADSAQYYVESLRAQILAHDPSALEGKRVKFEFVAKSWEDGYLQGGRLKIPGSPDDIGKKITVEGVIRNGRLDTEGFRDSSGASGTQE